jgi:phosphatidate cytidylyltransferase
MALNWQTFRTRTLTSLVFVTVMLAGLLFNHWTFFLLFTVIHFGCWVEYQKLIGFFDKDYQQINSFHKYGVMLAGWCIMLWFTSSAYQVFGIRLHELGLWLGLIFLFLLPITELLFTRNIQLKNIGYSALGILCISLTWGLMIDLGSFINNLWMLYVPVTDVNHTPLSYFHFVIIPFAIITSLWANDTMAYLLGSLIGKTPLTRISPKKTVEGTLSGILFSIVLIGLIFSNIHTDIIFPGFYFKFPSQTWYIIAGISAITGTFGDILESKLKRMAGVKDSGQIMPGHGGFLDRFDSLIGATPFVWLYVYFFIL